MLRDWIKNKVLNQNRYKTRSDAVIIGVFYNPKKNPYRLAAFLKFYESIKHLNYRFLEITIGEDYKRQLPQNDPNIEHIHSESLLWHKEAGFQYIIKKLPRKFTKIVLADLDIKFTDDEWLVKACRKIDQGCTVVQPFEWAMHLNQNCDEPDYDVAYLKSIAQQRFLEGRRVWRSCAANNGKVTQAERDFYPQGGHTGLCWVYRRDVLEKVPLYSKALAGTTDHIAFHAIIGDYQETKCLKLALKDDLHNIYSWCYQFHKVTQGKLGYVEGNECWHMWHGDLGKRWYLKRTQDFTKIAKNINELDENGLAIHKNDPYMEEYFSSKEFCGDNKILDLILRSYYRNMNCFGKIKSWNWLNKILKSLTECIVIPNPNPGSDCGS